MNYYSEHRLLLPETIWLESEDYQQATAISNRVENEKQSWQTYLNLLGLFALKSWLSERLPHQQISEKIDPTTQIYYLQVGEFTVGAIATENLLDEVVDFPQQLQQATHFYVLLEIIEEAEEAIVRGLLRCDRLQAYLNQTQLQPSDKFYQLPLSLFDPEPNHLLFYCQYLQPDAITLSVSQNASNSQPNIAVGRTKLTQWLQNTLIEGWSTIESLIDPQMNLALSTRSSIGEYKRGKLINLGVELNNITMVLLITVKQEEEKLGVLIQLYPRTREQNFLPPQVQLTLLSKAGKILQSVEARQQDNYIQLKPFKGQPGKRFSLEISLENTKVREDFEL